MPRLQDDDRLRAAERDLQHGHRSMRAVCSQSGLPRFRSHLLGDGTLCPVLVERRLRRLDSHLRRARAEVPRGMHQRRHVRRALTAMQRRAKRMRAVQHRRRLRRGGTVLQSGRHVHRLPPRQGLHGHPRDPLLPRRPSVRAMPRQEPVHGGAEVPERRVPLSLQRSPRSPMVHGRSPPPTPTVGWKCRTRSSYSRARVWPKESSV
jgi:hypothetical protein